MIENIMIGLAVLAIIILLPGMIMGSRRKLLVPVEEFRLASNEPNTSLVIDVREPDEFMGELGHVRGAINIPMAHLEKRRRELGFPHEKNIYVVCRTDIRSMKAAKLMLKWGYSHVKVVRKGMVGWNEHGYPVQRGD